MKKIINGNIYNVYGGSKKVRKIANEIEKQVDLEENKKYIF